VVAVAMDYYDDYRAFVSAAKLEKNTVMYIRLTFLVTTQTMRQRYIPYSGRASVQELHNARPQESLKSA
jgi:hypothetical protein